VRTLVILAVAACSYHPGSFADLRGPFAGTVQTIGCIDLAVGPGQDANVEDPIVAYGFGNRCRHSVTLDLASVRVVARDAAGRERDLVAYDPRGEIRPTPIEARWSGREQIEYVEPAGPLDSRPGGDPRSIVSVCVDVGGVDATVPRTERWVCTGRTP
jgi:hypothetical protein